MALVATTEYYDATDVAIWILPHLVVLSVDSDRYTLTPVQLSRQMLMMHCLLIWTWVVHIGSTFMPSHTCLLACMCGTLLTTIHVMHLTVRMKAFQATEVFLKTHHLKVVANFLLNKIAVLEIVCLKVVVTFESCGCGACRCITGKLCQSPYWRLLLMEKVDDMRAMGMLQLNAGDSVVLPTTVTGSTTTGLLGYATPLLLVQQDL